ncbi:MAG: hypothetical protein ACKOZU_02620 [Planctomycetaceae bacterium]
MSLDPLDAVFLRRLAIAPGQPEPAAAVEPPRAAGPADGGDAPPDVDPVAVESPVERLLARVPAEWAALAGHVEAARQRGLRTIAVAGSRPREGRSTLVECLATTLRSRGREVACASPTDLARVADGPDGRGPTHDRRIILVDAGIWFPPGPIRRSTLQFATQGCDAVILVRRAGAAGGFARQAALEALGIEVLGEVLTFTGPLEAADRDGGAAA